jgi:hypothetical protein
VRPAGRTHLGVRVHYRPGRTGRPRATVSLTARVSIARTARPGGIRRKQQANRWSDEDWASPRNCMEGGHTWTRGQIDSKSATCTEGVAGYAAGISGKVGTHYPGRSVGEDGDRDRVEIL